LPKSICKRIQNRSGETETVIKTKKKKKKKHNNIKYLLPKYKAE